MLRVVKYLLQSYSASVKQRAISRKLKAGSAQTVPNVVLLQCLKQEHSINYHDYLKRRNKERKEGAGRGRGEPGSSQFHPCGVLPQALHWRHNDTVRLKAGAGNTSSASLLIIEWVCHHHIPASMAKSAEVKLAIFGRAGVGKSGMFDFWFSFCLHLGNFFWFLCADKLFIKRNISDLLLVREVGITPGMLSSLAFHAVFSRFYQIKVLLSLFKKKFNNKQHQSKLLKPKSSPLLIKWNSIFCQWNNISNIEFVSS